MVLHLQDYNCSVDFIRSIFLVRETIREGRNGTEDAKLKLDELDATTPAYQTADIVVFNTGHWWTHYKTSRGYIVLSGASIISSLGFHNPNILKCLLASPQAELLPRG